MSKSQTGLTKTDPFIQAVHDQSQVKHAYANNRVVIKNKLISGWDDENQDGIQVVGNGKVHIRNSVFDREGHDPSLADELVSGVDGADIVFYRCRFKNNGKGYLQGSGDSNDYDLAHIQRALFYECIFENCSRRSPFIQVGQGYMSRCWVRNWGQCFETKSYGSRAGDWGQLMISNTVFEQESFLTCLKRGRTLRDVFCQYLRPLFGIPGFMRGAYADVDGQIFTHNCYKNRWWIYLQNRHGVMSKGDALLLMAHLESVVPDTPKESAIQQSSVLMV